MDSLEGIFRTAYRGTGVAWPEMTPDGPKPAGWPYMSMDEAAKLSAETTRRLYPVKKWPDYLIMFFTIWIILGVAYAGIGVVAWFGVSSMISAGLTLAIIGVAGMIAVAVLEK